MAAVAEQMYLVVIAEAVAHRGHEYQNLWQACISEEYCTNGSVSTDHVPHKFYVVCHIQWYMVWRQCATITITLWGNDYCDMCSHNIFVDRSLSLI